MYSADPHVNVLVKSHLRRKHCVHELFGFDVILDQTLKPWIVEVNISPSLHSTSPLDVNIKGRMIADLLNLAGYRLPNPKDVKKSLNIKRYATLFFDKCYSLPLFDFLAAKLFFCHFIIIC